MMPYLSILVSSRSTVILLVSPLALFTLSGEALGFCHIVFPLAFLASFSFLVVLATFALSVLDFRPSTLYTSLPALPLPNVPFSSIDRSTGTGSGVTTSE